MGLFSKPASSSNWLAVVPQGTRLDIVSVEQRSDARPRVTRCESYPLDGGLGPTLSRLRQGGKLDGRCATLLSTRDYQFLSVETPPLPDTAPQAELRDAVRWKIKDMVDFPVTAAGVDALRIPPQPGRPTQLLVAASSHGVLKPLVEAVHAAKCQLAAITVPEIAQRNFARLFETPDRALALLSFNAHSGMLTLSCNGELHGTRHIDVGAADLAHDKSLYERVVLDVQRSLDHFDRNFSHLSLQRLLVVPVSGADDFIPHLRENLYQPVETLAVSEGLDIDAAPMLANAATLADALPALGLALGLAHDAENLGINLYDSALVPQRDDWNSRNLGLGLAASLLLCVAWGAWAHWNQAQLGQSLAVLTPQVETSRAEALQLGKQITGYMPDARLQAALDDSRVRLDARGEVLALLRRGMSPETGNPGELMRGFARQIPTGLWLTGFSVKADNGALEIHGRTTDPRLIPEYVRRLNAEQSFKGRTFAALEIVIPDQKAATAGAAVGAAITAVAAQAAVAPPPVATSTSGPPRFHEFALTSAQGGIAPGGPL